MPTPPLILMVLVALTLPCAACRSSDKSASPRSRRGSGAAALMTQSESHASVPSVRTAGPTTPAASSPSHPPTPIPPAPADEPRIAASPEAAVPPPASATPNDPASVRTDTARGAVRSDGRPEWWFGDARRESGITRLCAEALGSDMAEARRAAVEAGRARMRKTLSIDEHAAVPGESVERVWVWPLPNALVGPNRYAGYVLIAAATDEPRSTKD